MNSDGSSLKILIILLALFFVSFVSLRAQDSKEEEILNEENITVNDPIVLDTITVTGTGTIKNLRQTPVQTEIISEEFIRESGAVSLDDVLKKVGLQYAENAMGSFIQLQGMSGERVLFLIDGKRLTGRVAGNFLSKTIPVDSIERIEIVKGPQSALYGSDAIGGVINIITKKPKKKISGGFSLKNSTIPISKGSDPDRKTLLREQSLSGFLNIPLSMSSNRLSFFGAKALPYLDKDNVAIYPEYKQGKIGLDSDISLNISTNLLWGGEYSFHREDDQTNSRGSFDRVDTKQGRLYTTGKLIIDNYRAIRCTVYYNYFDRLKKQYSSLLASWFDSGDEHEDFLGTDIFYSWFLSDNNELDIAVSYTYDQLEKYNIQNYELQKRQTMSLVIQDSQYESGKYSIVGGIRSEYSNDYGWFFAPKLSGMVFITKNFRILPAIGVGYRAPNFLELYLDKAGNIYHKFGNPDLKPEKSLGTNLGLEWFAENAMVQANVFHNELADEIAYDYTDDEDENGLQIIIKENLTRSFRTGFDITGSLSFLRVLETQLRYGFLYGYNRSKNVVLEDKPAHSGSIRITRNFENIGLTSYIEGNYQGKYDHRDKALVLINLYIQKSILSLFSAFFGVDNITGETDDYSTYIAGPVIYAGMKGRF